MKWIICITLALTCCQISAQENIPVTFTHDGLLVYGTLSVPAGNEPFPTIIITPGSGPNDRDGTLQLIGGNSGCLYPELEGETLKPYKELADALVDSGFAVLRYDKLEFTYPASLNPITFHKLWLPVESAIDYIKTRADVDTNRIILLGHSEGSALIPVIAAGRTDIKALISVAGARTPFDSILAYQIVHFANLCDGDTTTAQIQANQIYDYFQDVRTGPCVIMPSAFGVSACVWQDYYEATDPVADFYNQHNLPTLFIGLENDINVPISELFRFQQEVTITDDFWTIPGLNHYMTPHDEPHVSQVLSDTIVYWLRHKQTVSAKEPKNVNIHTLKLFPNPALDWINISLPDIMYTEGIIRMYDANGHVRYSSTVVKDGNVGKVKVQDLPPGLFIVEYVSSTERRIGKFIKL